MVKDREQACGVDTHQPIRPLPAAGGGKEIVILPAAFQLTESLFDGAVLHRGNPQAVNGLFTAGHLIDVAEDKLAFTSRITGVDNIGHILPVHQLLQCCKLAVLILGDFVPPVGGNNRQVIISPLGKLLVIGVGVCKLSQMAESPGYNIVTPLNITRPRFPLPPSGRRHPTQFLLPRPRLPLQNHSHQGYCPRRFWSWACGT